MSFEQVQVVAAGQLYEGWTETRVTAGFGQATRDFEIQVTEIGPDFERTPWHFPPNTEVTVLATGDLLLDGFIDDYQPAGDKSGHTVTISGRGKGRDYVDSSAWHPTGRFEGKSVAQIAQELDTFGVGIRIAASAAQAAAKIVPWFQLRLGATPWAEMLRLLAQRGLTMTGLADGAIEIAKAAAERHAGGLIQGQNIERMSARLTAIDQYSSYTVIGQSPVGTEAPFFEPKGTATDPSVPAQRKKIIIDQAVTDNGRAQQRADLERARAAGWSATAEISLPSWRDDAGRLWEPGWNVYVHAPWLKLDQDMMIKQVDWTQNNTDGTMATLSLWLPQAGGGSAPPASGSGGVWGMFN